MQEEQSQAQKEALEEALSQGQAFEDLIRSKGWEYVKKYYQSKVQSLASGILIRDKVKIEDFEDERRELIGIRKLLGFVEDKIELLRKKIKDEEEAKRVSKE